MDLELAFKSGELESEKSREELKAAGSSCCGTVGQGACSVMYKGTGFETTTK